ncbi:MAG: P-loop NTPase fold protein [Lachnospiraceae bacterium]
MVKNSCVIGNEKMEKSIEIFLQYEKLFDWYFVHRDIILYISIWAFIMICVCSIAMIKEKNGKIEYRNTFMKSFLNIILIICVGIALKAVGLEVEFAVAYVPMLLFFFAGIMVVVIQIFEVIRFYKNFEEVIKKTIVILIDLVLVEIFLLEMMARLEVIEAIAATTFIFALKEINELIDFWTKEKGEIAPQVINTELHLDCPIESASELFSSRKKQAKNFCAELSNIGVEPFAVMVSASWGSGKTSFVNVIKKDLDNAEFIDVEGGFEYDVRGILNDIETQIQLIFTNNRIYAGKNGIIGKYFKNIGSMVGNAGFDWPSDILYKIVEEENKGYLESKQEMNAVLNTFYKKTGKRIFIIIDNIDRIFQNEARERMFQVISESVKLNNCVTIFVAEYNKLLSERMNQEFMEKYINHHLVLCDVSFEEIAYQYMNEFLSNEFLNNKSAYIRENCVKFKNQFWEHVDKIVNGIRKQILDYEQYLEKNKDGVKETETTEKNRYETEQIKATEKNRGIFINAEKRLNSRTKNPRKVKRFLNNIESMITVADIVWFANGDFVKNEYSGCDWVKKIFEVAFLKAFLYEEYESIILAEGIDRFKNESDKCCIAEYVIEGLSSYLPNPLMEQVTGLVIYRLYALDINSDKTQHQILVEEIDGDELTEENLQGYLNECLGVNFNHQRIKKIIQYIKQHTFQDQRNKCEAILNIMNIISSKEYLNRKKGYFEISKDVKDLLLEMEKESMFTNEDLNIIEHCKKILQERIIFENQSDLRILSELLHNVDMLQYFEPRIDTMHQLYEVIKKINIEHPIEGIVVQDNETQMLKNYYNKMKIAFESIEYEYINEELKSRMNDVDIILKILFLWSDEKSKQKVVSLYNNSSKEFEAKIYESVDTVFQGIGNIKKYVQANTSDEGPGNAFIDLVSKIEEKMKTDVAWFEKRESELVEALIKTFEYFQETNPAFAQSYDNRWRFTKIRLFRLQRVIKNGMK